VALGRVLLVGLSKERAAPRLSAEGTLGRGLNGKRNREAPCKAASRTRHSVLASQWARMLSITFMTLRQASELKAGASSSPSLKQRLTSVASYASP